MIEYDESYLNIYAIKSSIINNGIHKHPQF